MIRSFRYPRLGPGMMWEAFSRRVEANGGSVLRSARAVTLVREGSRITSVVVRRNGRDELVRAGHVVTSMPLDELVRALSPAVPADVLAAAEGLRYRDFILVGLVLRNPVSFPDNWLYIHSPDVRVGRIQNFGSWSRDMVGDAAQSCLGLEYFCTRGDDLWERTDAQLAELARMEIGRLGLADPTEIVHSVVIRQEKAYPVYDAAYRSHLEIIRRHLASIENLQTVGRNGMHRYNNQDHSMLTGMLAVRNIRGERHDLWNVNTDRSYYEDFRTARKAS
jgi:protoporphyrinogen oxidase